MQRQFNSIINMGGSIVTNSRAVAVLSVEMLALVAGCLAAPATAHDRFRATRLDSGLTIVPFAVPVATPVAVVQSGAVHYAYVPPVAKAEAELPGGAELRAEFEAFRQWRQSQRGERANPAAAAEPNVTRPSASVSQAPLMATHCLKCHSGAQAKGAVRLDGVLSNEQRLAAIRAVLAGDMPKGKPLESDVLGELLFELSQSSSTSSVQGE
jgi:hypothetical protein